MHAQKSILLFGHSTGLSQPEKLLNPFGPRFFRPFGILLVKANEPVQI